MGGAPDIDLYTVEWGVPASIVASLLVIAAAAQQAWLGIIGRHDRAE